MDTHRGQTTTMRKTNVNVWIGQKRVPLPLTWRIAPNGVLTSGCERARYLVAARAFVCLMPLVAEEPHIQMDPVAATLGDRPKSLEAT